MTISEGIQFYLLVFGMLFFVCIQKPNAVVLYFLFWVLLAFASLNIELSVDYPGYIAYFNCSVVDSCSDLLSKRVESSYIYISRLISVLGGDGYFAVFFYICVSIFIKVLVIGKSAHFGIALFAYVAFGFFVHEMTQVRVGLAIAFIWLAVLFSARRRMVISLLTMAAAFVLHNSSIVAILHFILKEFSLNKYAVVVLFVMAALFGYLIAGTSWLSYLGLPDPRFATYLAADPDSLVSTPQFTVNVTIYMVSILLAYYLRGGLKYDRFSEASLNLSVFGVLIYLAFYWVPVVGLRVMELFTSFMPFVIAAAYKRSNSYYIKIIFILLVFGIFINLFVRNISPFSEENEPVPFDVSQSRVLNVYG